MPGHYLKRWWNVIHAQTKQTTNTEHITKDLKRLTMLKDTFACFSALLIATRSLSTKLTLGKITDCLIHPLESKIILSLVPH